MDKTEFYFNGENLEEEMRSFSERKITELFVHDTKLASDKKALVHFLSAAIREIPDVFVNIKINAVLLDSEVICLLQELFCSVEIPMTESASTAAESSGRPEFFDRRLFSKKAALLNGSGLVFGFDLDFALTASDSFKAFRERLDFALSLYPNHIEFPQLENGFPKKEICTGTYSSREIEDSKKIARSAHIFYTQGRSVPWFSIVLKPLKIAPSKFFSDFAEWLLCSNISLDSGFDSKRFSQKEIERMQLLFLELKYEEKQKMHLYVVAKDIVTLYGAFSRVDFENEESVVQLSFSPDDLLSPVTLNLQDFADSVCMRECTVKISAGEDAPEYKIIG